MIVDNGWVIFMAVVVVVVMMNSVCSLSWWFEPLVALGDVVVAALVKSADSGTPDDKLASPKPSESVLLESDDDVLFSLLMPFIESVTSVVLTIRVMVLAGGIVVALTLSPDNTKSLVGVFMFIIKSLVD